WKVRLGWLPLHPTVYIKREVIERCGLYDESYKIAADSDFLVRYMYKEKLKIKYFDKYILKMRMGGNSTDSRRRKEMWNEDVRMFKGHGFWGVPEKLMKMCWKVPQFVNAKLKKNLGNG
ncbi:MAG: glycosyltransferase, partial [Bacteroidaceae bacterium]|nr:glycosyltransferase [Bacteroidaceae bacterium]